MKSIVLTGGGTAGHTTPHFALIENLKKHFDNIYYIGSQKGIEYNLVKEQGIPFYTINPAKLKRKFCLDNFAIPFKTLKSISDAKKILTTLKPSVVFSKGGFVGLPVTIASKQLKIPVVIHESDLSLGLANRIASSFSNYTLTSFEKTAYSAKNGVFVGSIMRRELFSISYKDGLNYYGFSGNKPILLVTGGSMGAKFLNDSVLKILPKLLKIFDVLHIVGKGNLNGLELSGYKQVEFTQMKYAYAVCSLCVSRAGANTAFELIIKNVPTLFIPLPKGASRGDQIDNANYFLSKGLAYVLYQEDANETTLYNKIIQLYKNSEDIKKAQQNFNYPIANDKICEILKEVSI